MNRLVVFANPRDVAARVLLPALLEAVARRADLCCVGILVPGAEAARAHPWRHGWQRGVRWMQWALGTGRRERTMGLPHLDPVGLARRFGLEVWPLSGVDYNHPLVIDFLRRQARADLALSIYPHCLFRADLLACFDMAVNYHNGSLPAFRGWRASNWSHYLASPRSGYTFHRMDAGLDTGNVLIAGEVAVDPGETPGELEMRKAEAARRRLPALLDALVARSPGVPQTGIGCVYTRQAYALVTRVEVPSTLTRHEWARRLRAFLHIDTRIDGRWWPVTGLAPAAGPGRLVFRSADGHWLRVSGLAHWPAWLWRRLGRGAAE